MRFVVAVVASILLSMAPVSVVTAFTVPIGSFTKSSATVSIDDRRLFAKPTLTKEQEDLQAPLNDEPDANPLPVIPENTQPLQQQTMEEPIFQFNKFLIDTVYNIICFVYPIKGTKRDYARFYVLETVARVPYFAYLSVLHLRETFGERENPLRMRTHYAQADNEYHHLLIMESLGGNDEWFDRFVAQTMAFGYYWYVILMYFWKEPAAYHLSELIEDHAFDTYDGFLQKHADILKKMPVPDIASKYYERDNPFLFDLFCCVKDNSHPEGYSTRRPKLESLYDVFVNIRDDEKEHWKTLCNLVQYNDMNAVPANQVTPTKPTPASAS